MTTEIRGVSELLGQLSELSGIDPTAIVRRQAELVRAAAVRLAPVNHGELRSSIKTMVEATDTTVTGIVYTNKEYAQYVEFGTGPVGAAHHEGISPDVAVTYRTSGWWIPEDKIDPKDAEKYHFRSIEYEGKKFYYCRGQRAQPFMYPAAKTMEPVVIKNLRRELGAHFKEAVR